MKQPRDSNSEYTSNMPIRIWKKGDLTRIHLTVLVARYEDSYASNQPNWLTEEDLTALDVFAKLYGENLKLTRDHSFSAYAKLSEKLTFVTP